MAEPTGTAQANTEAGKGTEPNAEQLHDAAITAVEAWQAKPDDEALKEAAKQATTKAKESYRAEKKTAEEKAAALSKPPDKYELKLPQDSPLSAAHIDKVSAYAKQKGLSNDQAQALLERESQAVVDHIQGQKAELDTTAEAWKTESAKDPEIGGESFGKHAELAKRVIVKFGSETLREQLSKTGLGNHPELVRMLYRIGKAMTDDQLVIAGSQQQPVKKSAEEILYGGTEKKDGQQT